MSLLRNYRFRNFVKNSGMLLLSSKLQAFVLFGQSILVARSLGVSRYGQWAIVVSFCGLLVEFFSFRSGDVLSKFAVELRQKGNYSLLEKMVQRVLFVDFATNGSALVIAALCFNLISRKFNGPDDIFAYLFFALSLALGFVSSSWFTLERDCGNFRFISTLNFFRTFSCAILIVFLFLILKKTDLRFLAFAFLLVESFVFAVKSFRINFLLKKSYASSLVRVILKKFRPDELYADENREFWRFMRTTYFSSSTASIIKKLDLMAAGYFFSAESVGFLKMGKSLAGIIQDVSNDMGKPIYQDFNELIASGELGKIRRFLNQYFLYYLAAVIAMLFVLGIVAGPVISLAYGAEYLPAVPFFRIYLFLVFLFIGFFWMDPLIVSLGRYKAKLLFQLIALTLYLPLLYVGVKTIGIFAIVGAYSIVVALIFVLMGLCLRGADFGRKV